MCTYLDKQIIVGFEIYIATLHNYFPPSGYFIVSKISREFRCQMKLNSSILSLRYTYTSWLDNVNAVKAILYIRSKTFAFIH